MGAKEFQEINFQEINLLPTEGRVEQPVTTNVFVDWNGTSPFYVNELFVPSRNFYKTRSHMNLDITLRRDNLDQYSISFMGPSIWNKLSNSLKILNTENELTLDYKKLVLKNLNK